ncbi:MAG: hypothetical protein ACJ77K_06045 [Bacteroidia bacterium]
MIEQLTDHAEVWYLLEKANAIPPDFSVDHVLAFDLGDDFYIVRYDASVRSFCCFIARSVLHNVNVLAEMIVCVQEWEPAGERWKEQAVKLIEHKLHAKNNTRFFFDAH